MSIENKSRPVLLRQVKDVRRAVGCSLYVPSLGSIGMVDLPNQVLQERYPVRYGLYAHALSELRKNGSFDRQKSKQSIRRVSALNNLDRYISKRKESDMGPLKPKQMTVFEAIRDYLEQGGKDTTIKLPTGVGKTVLFSEIIEAMDVRTLILVPRTLLVHQTREELSRHAPAMKVGILCAESKDSYQKVTIATLDSFRNQVARGVIKPDHFDLIVIDEEDMAHGAKTSKIIAQQDRAIKLRFSATPRKDNHFLYKMTLAEARQEGLVAPYESWIAVIRDVNLDEVTITQNGDYNPAQLEHAVNVSACNASALKIYQDHFPGKKTFAFCSGVQHAMDFAALCNVNGHAAAVLSGKDTPKRQQEILAHFSRGEIQILCSADILIRGTNVPEAEVCLNLRPTLSPAIAEQRAGRVVRLDPHNPDKKPVIVDFFYAKTKRKVPIFFNQVAVGMEIGQTPQPQSGTAVHKNGVKQQVVEVANIKTDYELITDPSAVEEMIMHTVSEQQAVLNPPENWISTGRLAQLLGCRSKDIRAITKAAAQRVFRMTGSTEITVGREYVDPVSHRWTTFFPPQFIELFRLNVVANRERRRVEQLLHRGSK
ncbi:MAG: DEAD/DEAH box helicase [bacterium]